MANKQDWINKKTSFLISQENYKPAQAYVIANSLYDQEHKYQSGGVVYDYDKAGNTDLNTADVGNVKDMIGIEFTPEFINSYFSKDVNQSSNGQSGSQNSVPQIDYTKLPVQDITSSGLFTDRKVWRTQRPEWFLGKKDAVEGKDYTVVPYKQWEAYQQSPEYIQYMTPQQTAGTMQQGGNIGYNFTAQPNFTSQYDYQSAYNPESFQLPNTMSNNNGFQYNPFAVDPYNTPSDTLQQQDTMSPTTAQDPKKPMTKEQWQYLQLINPNSGSMSLEGSLAYTGKAFGEGNILGGIAGTALSALKGARSALSGYAAGKSIDDQYKEYLENQYKEPQYQMAQQGGRIGEITNGQAMTGAYLTENLSGANNVELEGGEHVKDSQTQEVKEVVGEPHTKGGVKAELADGSQVLSDYTKLGAEKAKNFRETYDINLKADDTFATVMDKVNSKIGWNKIIKEEEEILKEIETVQKKGTDVTTQGVNMEFLSKNYQELLKEKEQIKQVQATAFEDIFKIQETVAKKGKPGEILDDKGNPILQEGGTIQALAIKYNIPIERAQELALDLGVYQQGGETQGQDVLNQVQMALQQGVPPEEIIQQLIAQGMPAEQAQETVEQVIQPTVPMAQQGFTFSTRYTPTIEGYDVNGQSVVDQDSLKDVEDIQSYTGQGYGKQARTAEDLIKLHTWYFDTEAKKKAFIAASKKEGSQPEIVNFQNAYNTELRNRAEKAGISKEETNKIVEEVGFSGRGVKKFDGLMGAFTSTRPLYNFSKTEQGAVKIEETPLKAPVKEEVIQEAPVKRQVLPGFSPNYVMPPGGLQPVYKPDLTLGRIEAPKESIEPNLANLASQNLATQFANSQTLSPEIAAIANSIALGQTQGATNQAIAQKNQLDNQRQFAADQFNIGQADKEKVANIGFAQDYERKMYQAMTNTDRDWRKYFNQVGAEQKQFNKDVSDLQLTNALYPDYQSDGSNIYFSNKPIISQAEQSQAEYNKKFNEWFQSLSSEQRAQYVKENA